MPNRHFFRLVAALAVLCVVAAPLLAGRKASPLQKQAVGEQAELFEAIDRGDIEVKLIPKDVKQATVIVKNNLKKPLRIKLPEAFVGVPVLAQRDDGGIGGGNDTGGGNANQSMGGGMMGGMGGMGMGGMGMGGMFNVGPDKIRRLKVATVCLEHGKEDPNPRIPYEIRPIETFTKDKAVIEVCKMLGRGKISQHAAQAAAWHLTDDMSWNQLARKVKVRHLNGVTKLYFNQRDLVLASRIVNEAKKRSLATESLATRKSPGEIEAEREKLRQTLN